MSITPNIKDLEKLFDELWPLNRSITGNGLRESIAILVKQMDLELHEIPSGTEVYDWEVPPEWNCKEAYIELPNGEKICEYSKNNLHLLGYSEPIDKEMDFAELNEHLHSLPDQQDAIPYVTSYYKKRWGFCLSDGERQNFPRKGIYRVVIDSTLNSKGSLTIADAFLPGESKKEIIFSSYLCHPSMANNELSGPLMLVALYKLLSSLPKRSYSYRFLLGPETIGALCHLQRNEKHWRKNLVGGLVATCVGIDTTASYKRSKQDNSLTDRMMEHTLWHSSLADAEVLDFYPIGSDERQFCAPAFNFPIGGLCRGRYYEYPEYHTSLDIKELISFRTILETAQIYFDWAMGMELNRCYKNLKGYGEPQLGKRGLYPNLSTKEQSQSVLKTMMWLLSYSDGNTDLLEIAQRAGISILEFQPAIENLTEAGLIK